MAFDLSILKSIDFCFDTNSHMIQLGFLKLLKGSILHNDTHGALFLNEPPYEIIESPFFTFNELSVLREYDKIIDKFYNSGLYKNSISYALTLFDNPSDMLSALAQFLKGSSLS